MFVHGGLIMGIGAALLALLSIDAVKSSGETVVTIVTWTGIASILLGLGMLLLGALQYLQRALAWSATQVVELTELLQFRATRASVEDLENIYRMAFRFFEGDISPIEKMRDWQRLNPNVFWVIRRVGQADRLSGYFAVVPLKKRAAELVRKESLLGTSFSNAHLTRPDSKPYALYVGAVAAEGLFSRAAAISHLMRYLEEMKERGVVNAYTRPVTQDGLRLCRRRQFVIVDKKARDHLHRVHHVDLAKVFS